MSAHGLLRAPDHIHFGPGSRRSAAGMAARYGTRAAAIVDPYFLGTPAFAEILDDLRGIGMAVEVYSGVVPELPLDSVDAAADALRAHAPDVIIAIGGGSALDLAKLVALRLTFSNPLSDFYGENLVPGPVVPLVALPTTAGTGSEVTPVAVVADPTRGMKVGISDAALIPRVAIVDPELTVGAPATVSAYSGIDAMAHAAESFTARVAEPDWSSAPPIAVGAGALTSPIALRAVELLGAALPRVLADGGDMSARTDTSHGALLAGLAFGTAGVHLGHALQYPIGVLTHTPHGLGTGLLLPHVLRVCLPVRTPQIARLGAALQVGETGSDEARADAAIEALLDINRAIGIPGSLRDIGVKESDLDGIIESALAIGRLTGNAPMTATSQTLRDVVVAAFAGR